VSKVRIVIDVKSPVHPYVQIANQLRDGINSGAYAEPLPSYTAIASEAGVSPGVVRRAFQILKDEGLVYGVPGRGMFVTRKQAQ
jgi:DNA-binding GntR family transcriptional regulator